MFLKEHMVAPASEDFDRVKGTIAVRITELRKARGLSQETLADEAEVHRTYVRMLEIGQGTPSLMVITRLAVALGVGVSDLMSGGSQ